MKEILLKFEKDEDYAKFMELLIEAQVKGQCELDIQNNTAIIKIE